MIYLIYGDDQYKINMKVKEIIGIDKTATVSRFNGLDKDLSFTSLIDELSTSSLFGEKKVFILDNPFFLISNKEVKEDSTSKDANSINIFLDYVKNPCDSNDLIIRSDLASFNGNLKVFKELKKYVTEYSFKFPPFSEDERRKEVENFFINRFKQDKKSAEYMAATIPANMYDAYKEAVKLKLYGDDITLDVFDALVTPANDGNTLNLYNAMIAKDLKTVKRQLDNLNALDVYPSIITSSLATSFRFLHTAKYFKDKGFTPDQAANQYGIKPYRFKIAYSSLNNLNNINIQKILADLAKIDQKIKNGKQDIFDSFFDIALKIKDNEYEQY